MIREEAVAVLEAFMENPLFSDVHKAAFNIAIHDIEQRHTKGYEDGQKDALKAKGETIAREIVACKEAYEKGLQHGQELRAKEVECAEACGMKRAWEAARKILVPEANGGIPMNALNEIFGPVNVLEKFSASEAIEKIEAWEKKKKQEGQKQTEKNVDNIEVGDECICNCPDNQNVVVTSVLEREDQEPWVTIMRKDGACYSRSSNGLTKTGNHYDIQSILDAMKG